MQTLDVLLDGVDQLSLVLLDGTTDLQVTRIDSAHCLDEERRMYLRADKQRVKLREDAEHLVRVTSGTKSVAEARNDLVLHSCNAFVIRILSSYPYLAALYNVR